MLVRVVNNRVIRPNSRPGTFGYESELWNKLSPEEQRAISKGSFKALGLSLALAALGFGGIVYLGTRADLNSSTGNNILPIVKPLNNNSGNK